jgi:hypothetical protein
MRRFFSPVWMVWLALVFSLQGSSPRAVNALIYTEPARLEIVEGQSEYLQVMVMEAANLYGIDLEAVFDPADVQVVDADAAASGVQVQPGTFLKADFSVRNLADNQAGRLRYIVTQVSPTPAASGRGVLFTIRLLGKKADSTSRFEIVSAVMADRRGTKLPVTVRGADLVVLPQRNPTAVPTEELIFNPVFPTLPAATSTPDRPEEPRKPGEEPTLAGQPTLLAGGEAPTAKQPQSTAAILEQAGEVGKSAAGTGRARVCLSVCGLGGALALGGMIVWLVRKRRRKEKDK